MLIDIIAGARPNFMKIAPIIREIEQANSASGEKKGSDRYLEYRLNQSINSFLSAFVLIVLT